MAVMRQTTLLPIALACLLLPLSIIPAHAQNPSPSPAQSISPEKQALIKELLELTSSKKTLDAMLKAQADQMEKQLPEIIWQAVLGMKELNSLTPGQREALRLKVVSSSVRAGRRMYELLLERIDFNKLIEDISIPLYDKYLTEGELRDLIVFYKSTTGKKVIEVLPNLVSESLSRTSDIILPRIAELVGQIREEETQAMAKEIQETAKKTHKPARPSGRTTKKRPPN